VNSLHVPRVSSGAAVNVLKFTVNLKFILILIESQHELMCFKLALIGLHCEFIDPEAKAFKMCINGQKQDS
jgi:hypothetical protein